MMFCFVFEICAQNLYVQCFFVLFVAIQKVRWFTRNRCESNVAIMAVLWKEQVGSD